jgi:thymidylate synthase
VIDDRGSDDTPRPERSATGRYDSFHDAYTTELRRVFDDPSYYNAPRGNASRERLGVQFHLSDPRQRLPFLPSRRTNVVFNFAEALWYLSGRDDLDFIGYYAPSIRRYSMDGQTLTGTAYGRKILGVKAGRDQWKAVTELLADDPDTKRAVLQIFDGDELAVPGNIDVSCTLGLQFLLREGALYCIAYMRANDAYLGLTSDLFSFTFLQEFLATEIGARLGGYTHCVGSMHVYAPNDTSARAVLDDPHGRDAPLFSVPAMPQQNNWPAMNLVLEIEEQLRFNRHHLGTDLSGLDLPRYWEQVLRLFEIYRRVKHDKPVTLDQFSDLDPMYQYFLTNRWKERMPLADVA